jgi:hypothetical protein
MAKKEKDNNKGEVLGQQPIPLLSETELLELISDKAGLLRAIDEKGVIFFTSLFIRLKDSGDFRHLVLEILEREKK